MLDRMDLDQLAHYPGRIGCLLIGKDIDRIGRYAVVILEKINKGALKAKTTRVSVAFMTMPV